MRQIVTMLRDFFLACFVWRGEELNIEWKLSNQPDFTVNRI